MSFSDHKIEAFTHKISDLPDQPNMQPEELKAHFDSSPEELRQALNALCDALAAQTAAADIGFAQTAGVPETTVQEAIENVQSQVTEAIIGSIPSGSITGDKLAQDVRDRFSAIESAAATEVNNRTSADSNLQSQIDTHTGQLGTHSTQIASKCEIAFTTFQGDGTSDREIAIGYRPKAVIVTAQSGFIIRSAMALDMPSMSSGPVVITDTGFKVTCDSYSGDVNQNQIAHFCLIFK